MTLRTIIVALMIVPVMLSIPARVAAESAERAGEVAQPMVLQPGRTIMPLALPKGVDLVEAARAGRAVAIRLRGIRTDQPSNGGFTVRWIGHDEPLGQFNTFSLVGKTVGEDRTIVLAHPGWILRALAFAPDTARIAIDAPTKFSEVITVEGAELIIE